MVCAALMNFRDVARIARRRLHDGEGWVRRAQDDQPPVKEVGPYPSALFLHDGAGPGLLRAIIARREDYLGANFAESYAALVVTLAPFGPGCFSTTPTSKSIPTVRACVCKPHAAVTPGR